MSHSEPQASTLQTGGGPPVFNGTYDTTSLLQEKRAASPTYQKQGGVLNVKAGKSHKKDRPKHHRPVPYFKSAIRADREDHRSDTSGTPSSSGAESERPSKRMQSSASKKPKSSAIPALAGFPGPTVPTSTPDNAPAETVPAITVPSVTTTNIFQPPPPPVAPSTAYTLTLPLAPSATPVQQVPLHLVHPKMLPEPLLKFIQALNFEEQSVMITIEEAVKQWAMLDEGHRMQIVTLYGRSGAQAHPQARDRAFEATVQASSSRGSGRGRSLATAPAPAAPVQASAETSSIAAQVVSRTASQGLISGYSTASSGTASSAPESSHVEDLNMEFMEEIVQNTTVPAQVPDEYIDIDIDDETSVSTSSISSVVRTSSRNKGKGRAQKSVDEGEADDESDMIEDDPEETASTPRHSTPTLLPQPANQAVGSSLDAQIGLLLVRKIESLDQSIRDQNAWYKEQAESNRAFQQAMLAEFQNMRSNQGTAQGGTSATFSPNTPKPTRINVAVLKAMQRSAKARKQELELTPEQLEHQQRILMRSRMQGHMCGLLKVNDLKDLVVRHPTLTEDEVKAWESGNGTIVCTPENLRVDFDRKWKQFSLNKVARRLVLFTFRKKADAGTFALFPPTPAMLTDEYLGPILDQYMKTLRRCYREALNPPDEAARQELLRRRAQNARMNTLYQTRVFVLIHMNYNQHSILFTRMAAANMSGDETDGPEVTHPPVYRIIIADWQSLELRTFLWALDAKYLAYWAKPPTRRCTGGNPARHRVKRDDSKTIPGVAPIGLWRNCYNSVWLETLQDWEIELLEIVDEDYDFTLEPPTTTSGSAGPSRRR